MNTLMRRLPLTEMLAFVGSQIGVFAALGFYLGSEFLDAPTLGLGVGLVLGSLFCAIHIAGYCYVSFAAKRAEMRIPSRTATQRKNGGDSWSWVLRISTSASYLGMGCIGATSVAPFLRENGHPSLADAVFWTASIVAGAGAVAMLYYFWRPILSGK